MPKSTTPVLKTPLSPERDHILGPAGAPIELVEYGDYQCPHCGRAHLVVRKLIDELGDALRFAYRHFPLAKIHPNARAAAFAAEAAGAQGKFWEMHNLLFDNQNALSGPDLIGYAKSLGLDEARFIREIESGLYTDRIQEDLGTGIRSGVNATPTFFINGKRHNAGYDYETLRPALG